MKRWMLCICFVLFFASVNAKQVKALPEVKRTIKTDTSAVKVHTINEAKLRQLREDRDFIYRETPPQQLSLWDRFWSWFWTMINKAISYGSSNPALKPIFIGLGIGVAIFILYKLFKSDKFFVSGGKLNTLSYDVIPDDIHAINYEAEIAAAIADNKFRMAIRLLYLRSLKQLSDHELISWQPNKTNYAYVNEVKKAHLQQPFKLLTLQFDYVWYGHFAINEQEFKPIHQSFNDFSTMLK